MNENQNHGQDGRLSEDYETPKRENPYLKKSRDKAPAPEKHGKEGYRTDREGYVRKRTFSDWMFEHVKLIATISTILVILALVLITDVVSVVENLVAQSQQAEKEEISLTYVKGLAERAEPITWGDLQGFRYDQSKAQDSITWMLSVKGTDYALWISGVSTEKPPSYVYLYDMKTGDRLAIGEEDFDAFIEAHS